jgi:hypothetical protein
MQSAPDGMKLGHRIALTFLIVVVILLAMAVFGYFTGRWEAEGAPQEPQLYKGLPLDATLLPIDKQALDEAYKQHLIRLWNVWLTDGAREAHRITTGLQISRQSYHTAAQQIEKREQQLREQTK